MQGSGSGPRAGGGVGGRTRNYALGLCSGYVYTAATIAVGLWLTPFTLRFLDREQFAIFTLATDLLMWLTLLDFGITSALRIQAAQLSGKPDPAMLNRLASTAFFAELGVVAVLLVAGVGVAWAFPHVFAVRPDLHGDAKALILLLLAGTALSLATQTFSALLVAHQQAHVDNALNLANLAVRTVLTVGLLWGGWGVCSLGVANLASKTITALLAILRTYRMLPDLRLRRSEVSWQTFKGVGRVGLWFSVGGLAGMAIASLDRIVAAKMVSVEVVTTLSLTGRLYALAATVLDPIANTARPMLAQLVGSGKYAEAGEAYHQLSSLCTGLAVVAAASIWAGNAAFVGQWVGQLNYGGWMLDLVFALRLVMNSWLLPNRATLAAGLYRVPEHALTRLAEAILVAGFAVVLGRRFGVVGIVAAGICGAALISAWALPMLTAQMFRRPGIQLIRSDAGTFLLLAAAMVPWAWAGRWAASAVGGGWLGAATAALTCGLPGMAVVWLVGFRKSLRGRLTSQSRGVFERWCRRMRRITEP